MEVDFSVSIGNYGFCTHKMEQRSLLQNIGIVSRILDHLLKVYDSIAEQGSSGGAGCSSSEGCGIIVWRSLIGIKTGC